MMDKDLQKLASSNCTCPVEFYQVNHVNPLRIPMRKSDLLSELVATYQKHGWALKGALLQSQTRSELSPTQLASLDCEGVKESTIDALWFARPSHHKREAWELRLLAETQYALFETFEVDETEEQRDEVRLEMEARLRDYVEGGK